MTIIAKMITERKRRGGARANDVNDVQKLECHTPQWTFEHIYCWYYVRMIGHMEFL